MRIIPRPLVWTPYATGLIVIVLLASLLGVVLMQRVIRLFPGGGILFISETPFKHEIHLMDVNSGDRQRLTSFVGDAVSVIASPNGQRIALLAQVGNYYSWYIMEVNGAHRRLIQDEIRGDTELVWSPDSEQVAYFSGGNRISIADINGDNQRIVARGQLGDWSPVGRQLVFAQLHDGLNWEIYVLDVGTDSPQRLTDHDAADIQPVWSPDGQRIAFASDRDGDWQLYIMDAEGGDQRRVTFDERSNFEPMWSPDGQHIVYVSSNRGNSDVYVIPADGDQPRPLTTHEGRDHSPVWSPDGHLIAFVSDRDGNNEIYVMNTDGSDQRRLTWNDGDDIMPTWLP